MIFLYGQENVSYIAGEFYESKNLVETKQLQFKEIKGCHERFYFLNQFKFEQYKTQDKFR